MTNVFVNAAVEGLIDEAVARRIIGHAGGMVGHVYPKSGNTRLIDRLRSYNHAARREPWLVLLDLDSEAACAPEFRRGLLPDVAGLMCFRIVVHQVESWLLADREEMARFLAVSQGCIPLNPESEADCKRIIVNLAQRSRKRLVREGLVPRPESYRRTGIAYDSMLIEFVNNAWRPDVAATNAESLARCLRCLQNLILNAGVGHKT